MVAEPVAGLVTFTYRADGRRVGKETPSESKHFIYDLNRLLQETDDAGDPLHEYSSTLDEWGELVSEYDETDTLYHQHDALGSTDALLDDDEAAAASYAHRAFGLEAAHTGTAESSFTFVGAQNYYRDPELELYFAGARYYDPAAGRWVSEDPKGFEAGDENLFRYVGNNPVNKVDPSGARVELDIVDQKTHDTFRRPVKRTFHVWKVYSDETIVGNEIDGEDTIPAGTLLGTITFNQESFFRGSRDLSQPIGLQFREDVAREMEATRERSRIEAENRNQLGRVFQSVEYWFDAPFVDHRRIIRGVKAEYESPDEMSPERLRHFGIQGVPLPEEPRPSVPQPPVVRPNQSLPFEPSIRTERQYHEVVDNLGTPLTPRAYRQFDPNTHRRAEMHGNEIIRDIWNEVGDQLQGAILQLGLYAAGLGIAAALEISVVKSGAIRIVRKAKDAKDAVVEIPAATVNKIREILRKRKGGGKVTDAEVCEAVHDAVEAGLENVDDARLGRPSTTSQARLAPVTNSRTLTFRHRLKPDKTTDVQALRQEIKLHVDAWNEIIRKEGMQGLKRRLRQYEQFRPQIEAAGRRHTKGLGSAGEGKVWPHYPDMATGGRPKSAVGLPSDERLNSIIGGQANRLRQEIVDLPDDVTELRFNLDIQ